ncbi:hypothetical protein BD769DRAFT_1389630 [Suillus cothurnatus]|nr:hypothetical protein BD769DRAFT_1389630 [Suillus cothurnatus]
MVCEQTPVPKDSNMPHHISAKPVQLHIIPRDSPRVNRIQKKFQDDHDYMWPPHCGYKKSSNCTKMTQVDVLMTIPAAIEALKLDYSHSSVSLAPVPLKKASSKASRSKKRRHSSDGDEKSATRNKESDIDPYKEFLTAACCVARCIDVFCLALQQPDAAEKGELSEDKDTQMSSGVQEQYKRNFACLLQLAPSLKPLLSNPRKALELNTIIKKSQIGHYAAFNTKDHPIWPAIYDGSGLRFHMGINHPVLVHFLCPVRELKRFSEDANKALKDMQCGKVNLTTSALPAFLWARDPPGEDYDDDNMFKGMFDGYLLEQTMQHILTSPSSAYGGETRATHTCNAALHDMTTVEAVHIAYGCLQVHFGISTKNTWSKVDGAFNY